MGKFLTTASSLALTAILTTGFAYAIEGAEPDAKDGLTILASTPAEGAAIAAIEKDELITMVPAQFAEYPEMYIEYEIEQNLGEGWEGYKSFYFMTRNEEEGNYSATITRKFEFFEGIDYRVVYTAWESEAFAHGPSRTANIMGVAYVNFTGTTARYECSPYTLTSISPDPSESRVEGPILPNDCPYLTVIFDGPVNLGSYEDTGILQGQGMGNNPFGGGLVPVNAKEVEKDGETIAYAEEWHLTFGATQLANMDSPLEITIKATDEEGRVVQGNMGKDAGSYSLYTYNVEGQYGKLQFSYGAAPISYVSEIIVSEDGTSKGISPSWLKPASSIIITRNGEVVTTAKEVEQVYAPGQEDNPDATAVAARIILNETITEPGTYEVYIPGGYFNIGTQFDTLFQKEETSTFEVVAGPDYTAVPAAGVVTEIGSFAITYDVDANIAINPTADRVTLTAEDGTSIPVADFNAVGKTLTLALRGTITDPSTYTLCIPSGFVTVNDEAIPGIILEYTIEKQGGEEDLPAVFTPAPGSVLDQLPDRIDFIFPDYSEIMVNSGCPTIRFNDEEPVNLPNEGLKYDPDDEYNEGYQNLGEFAGRTEAGTYTITFPAGYFFLGSNDLSEEMVITYIVGGGETPCPAEFTPAAGSIAALPAEVTIHFPDYSEAGGGYGKATIQFNADAPVNLSDARFHTSDNNGMIQPLDSFAGSTEKGTYTIHFPEGYFVLGSGGNDESPAMDVVYEVNENTGVTNVTVKADRYVVFDLNGVQVLDTTDAEALKALKGIYIVNGIKIAF